MGEALLVLAGVVVGGVLTLLGSVYTVRYEMRRIYRARQFTDSLPKILMSYRGLDVHNRGDKQIAQTLRELLPLRWDAIVAGPDDIKRIEVVFDVCQENHQRWLKAPENSDEERDAMQEVVDALQAYHDWLNEKLSATTRERTAAAMRRTRERLRHPLRRVTAKQAD